MSLAHAQKYYDIVSKDPALLSGLEAGAASADEFIARAITAAKQQGLEFSADEAQAYLQEQAAEQTDGELSDQQLEAVAGGKSSKVFNVKWFGKTVTKIRITGLPG